MEEEEAEKPNCHRDRRLLLKKGKTFASARLSDLSRKVEPTFALKITVKIALKVVSKAILTAHACGLNPSPISRAAKKGEESGALYSLETIIYMFQWTYIGCNFSVALTATCHLVITTYFLSEKGS